MKTAVVLTCLLAALAISAQAFEGLMSDPIVTGATNANGSNVTIVATISNTNSYPEALVGQVTLSVMSTNGLLGQLFQPESIVVGTNQACTWTNTAWNPYFTGDFIVKVDLALTNHFDALVSYRYAETRSTTVTVMRTIGGTMNSVKVAADVSATAYDANGAFANIDLNQVLLHNYLGVVATNGMDIIPCNLMNNPTNVNTAGMDPEETEKAFMDTGAYRTNGTPFRFNMTLHARPTSLMGFGEIMRFVWTPEVATNPAGRGILEADVTSCQPWRSGDTNKYQAHVGCAPLFVTDTNDAAYMNGMIMSTTAHYRDVSPVDNAVGIGLNVNGQSNQTSYLKAFIPDTLLVDEWGIPVDQATELLAGYTTHFTSNNVSKGDTAAVAPTFTRIASGGTNYAYSSTNGDAGYEARFTFTFQSPVDAQIGMNPFVEGDFDGDRLADPYVVDARGNWYIWLSGSSYGLCGGPWNFGVAGWPVAADFDGDGLADPAIVVNSLWYIWLSGASPAYSFSGGPWDFGVAGWPVAADFDGDRLADPAIVVGSLWYIWLSGASPSYSFSGGPWNFGVAGWPVAADFDGDRLADPAMVVNSWWYIWLSDSSPSYSLSGGPWNFGIAGWPVAADFDGDGKADPTVVVNNNWTFWLSFGGLYQPYQYPFVP